MKMINALLVAPGTAPYTVIVQDSTAAFADVIGGEPVVIYPWEESDAAVVFCKEQQDKDYNRVILSENLLPIGVIRGAFLITGSEANHSGPESLSTAQMAKYTKVFAVPDRFHQVSDGEMLIEKAVLMEGLAFDSNDEEQEE